MEIAKRFYHAPNDSCFILGPRGTGKSSWIKHNIKEAYIINLLNEGTYLEYLKTPGRLKEVVLGNMDTFKVFVIDEIQKIPQILDSVHELIEDYKDLQFILTGSSARKLKRTGVNLLAGRAVLTKMHPFMAAELGEHFNLERALQFGMLPLILNAKNVKDTLNSYIGLYLKEEVQSEGLVRNIGNFAYFLEIISFSHGSLLNCANIARECGVSHKIVENYVSILEDLMLGYLLPVFTKRAKRELVSHSKFYYFDSGVYSNLRPAGPLDKPSEIDGMALEGLILQHLRAWSDYSEHSAELYFWRTKSGSEVDFIIYSPKYFFAIEVKNSTKVFNEDLSSLKAFISDYSEAKPILLYRGSEKIIKDGIPCWPADLFLRQLKPNEFLSL